MDLIGGGMLHAFISMNRDRIIERCTEKVAARPGPRPAPANIDHGVPMFLEQLVDELRLGVSSDAEIGKTATLHGHDLLRQGFTVSQVVHGYGDICQAITELAVETGVPISTDEFRMLNRCLDDAIAGAVTEYGREREQSGTQDIPAAGARLKSLARDLIKSTQISKVALAAIRSGSVGVAGSTATMLSLAVDTANDLAELLLVEVTATDAVPPAPLEHGRVG
jgi:hypothetical protein